MQEHYHIKHKTFTVNDSLYRFYRDFENVSPWWINIVSVDKKTENGWEKVGELNGLDSGQESFHAQNRAFAMDQDSTGKIWMCFNLVEYLDNYFFKIYSCVIDSSDNCTFTEEYSERTFMFPEYRNVPLDLKITDDDEIFISKLIYPNPR